MGFVLKPFFAGEQALPRAFFQKKNFLKKIQKKK